MDVAEDPSHVPEAAELVEEERELQEPVDAEQSGSGAGERPAQCVEEEAQADTASSSPSALASAVPALGTPEAQEVPDSEKETGPVQRHSFKELLEQQQVFVR